MPARFIAATAQFLKNIDITANELFNLAIAIRPKEIFYDQQASDSQTLLDDASSAAHKIRFLSRLLDKLHDIKRSDIEIKQIDIIDCLIEIYKLVASIENISYWWQLKNGQAKIASLRVRAQETAKLCERLEKSAAANIERYRINSEFGIDDVERKLANLAKEVEMEAGLFQASYADLLEKINNCDATTDIVCLIRERNKLVADETSSTQRLANNMDNFYKDTPRLINNIFEQSRAEILEGLYDHVFELKVMKRNVCERCDDENYDANEAMQAMQKQVTKLLGSVKELDAVWLSENSTAIDSLVLLMGILTQMCRPEMTDNQLLQMNLNQKRLLDEQKREILAMQIKQCKQLLERVDVMFAKFGNIQSERIKVKINKLKDICEVSVAGGVGCAAVDEALRRLLDKRAIKRKKFNKVYGELFSDIRDAFKLTLEFDKFQKYLENHPKKRNILPAYLAEIDRAENLQQLYKVLNTNFFVPEQPDVGLRNNTAQIGCYPLFHRGNSSTTEMLLSNLENALTAIVHSFELSDAANNSQYNHVSHYSK